MPTLTGKPIARRQPLFWCYFNAINERRVAMRDGNWKVLAKLDRGKLRKYQNVSDGNVASVRQAELTDVQIFNVPQDIAEANDLAASNPDKAAELQKKLEKLYRELANTAHYWKRGTAIEE